MNILLAYSLFAISFVFLFRKSLVSIAIGILLLGNAINLSLLLASKPVFFKFALILPGQDFNLESNDAVIQALILTAIVIGFALLSFLLALIFKLKSLGILSAEVWPEDDEQ